MSRLLAATFVAGISLSTSAQGAQGPIYNITPVSTATLIPNTQVPNLAGPQGMAVDPSGNLFVADTFNQRILEITPAGTVTVVAGIGQPINCCGRGPGFAGDGGLATAAQLSNPSAVAIDSHGNILIADNGNNRIRKFQVGGNINTIVGSGTAGFAGDGGPALSAQLNHPNGIAVDSSDNIFIADTNNNRIRMVSAATGNITTVAGSNSSGFSGDSGPATAAQLFLPASVAVDTAGNLYIADGGRVRKVVVGGNILTVAGDGDCCNFNFEDGGPATAAPLNAAAVALDGSGNLYIADRGPHNAIRMVLASTGYIYTIVGFGLNNPQGVAAQANGTVFISDSNNNRIEQASPAAQVLIGPPGAAVPGGTLQLPLTLKLTSGISLDTLAVSVIVYSPFGNAQPITFAANTAGGISPPRTFTATNNTFAVPPNYSNLSVLWQGVSTSTPPTVSGNVQLGTFTMPIPLTYAGGNSTTGTSYSASIMTANADLSGPNQTLTPVSLFVGPFVNVNVQNCTYEVGDTYPGTPNTTQCGTFASSGPSPANVISFEDVIQSLRAWGAAPGSGWDKLSCQTDLFDAFDSFPLAGGPGANLSFFGGDGQITLGDVSETLNRWSFLDSSREYRTAGTWMQRTTACVAASGQSSPDMSSRGQSSSDMVSRRNNHNEQPASSIRSSGPGAIELGAAQVSGNLMRVPVYFHASQTATSLAFSAGWPSATTAKLSFSPGAIGAPTILDTGVPGSVTAAWMRRIPAMAGQRILLGYLEWQPAEGLSPSQLQLHRVEANGERQAQ